MKYCLLPVCLLGCIFSFAQEPPRKAWMGMNGSFSDKGMAVDTVMPNSTASKLGVKKKDTILTLNDKPVTSQAAYNAIAMSIRTRETVIASYKRENKTIQKKTVAIMRPYDTSDVAAVVYGWTQMDNCKLRTIVRKPKEGTNIPAILFIPGYNCGSVENYGQGIYGKLINTWVKAGFAVVTIEKTGMGDSYECIPCIEADLATDIKVFDAGYRYMENLAYADKRNLFVFGHSMGGIIAPIIAQRYQPRGLIAFATVFRPWSEFLLEMHRVQWPLDGMSYAATEDRLRLIQKVYYEYFRLKKMPDELYRNPEYKELVASELEYKPGVPNMWGRSWQFWQQLDSVDLARSWAAVNTKVLSVFGGADYIACSELEHQLIVRAVNSTHPGNATHIRIPDVDHLITRNPDWQTAHDRFSDVAYRNTHFHQGFADTTAQWMQQVMVH